MKRAILDALIAARGGRRPAVLVTHLPSGAQTLAESGAVSGDLPPEVAAAAAESLRDARCRTLDGWFIHAFAPTPRLVIVGAVHIAQALAPMARQTGYAVTVVDPRAAFATPERLPGVMLRHDWPDEALAEIGLDRGTAVVFLTHDPKIDDPGLHRALRSDVFYIGALGSRRTHAKRVARLGDAGFTEAEIARIRAPIGLAIGAVSPAEIAVSILAEITAARRGALPA